MGYKMFEISQEKQTELMEHAEKAYEHAEKAVEYVGKMLGCIEKMGAPRMGMREDDEWYIRRMNQDRMNGTMGERDDVNTMGERRGYYGHRYGGRYGNRDPYFY